MPNLKIEDFQKYEWLWKTGRDPESGQAVTVKDALSTPNAPSMMPRVISNIVREAMEPVLVGTQLLQRVNWTAGTSIVTFPAAGALQAADIPEGGEYPEKSLGMSGATVTATIGKSGIAVKITEEMMRQSQFDVIGLHLRAAGKALARHKEQKIFNYIRSLGVVVFDNVAPTKSMKGVCTGRDLTGAANGSSTMDDVFDCWGQVMAQGFQPDTLLMHPLSWVLWLKDPVLRSLALAGAQGGRWFNGWQGDPRNMNPWQAAQGGLVQSGGMNSVPGGNAASLAATAESDFNLRTSAPQMLEGLPFGFRVLVSPLVPFDPVRKLTDIYMFESGQLGVLLVDHDVETDEFDDPSTDLRKLKLKERYGIGMLNEGQAIAVMKNVAVKANEIALPARANIDVAGSIAAISPTASVLS